MLEHNIQRGDRVSLRGYTGTVEALTKPYAQDEVTRHYTNGRWRTMVVAAAGDRRAKVQWDDVAATSRFNKWINTRSLTRLGS